MICPCLETSYPIGCDLCSARGPWSEVREKLDLCNPVPWTIRQFFVLATAPSGLATDKPMSCSFASTRCGQEALITVGSALACNLQGDECL